MYNVIFLFADWLEEWVYVISQPNQENPLDMSFVNCVVHRTDNNDLTKKSEATKLAVISYDEYSLILNTTY